ncbi:MAG: DUF1223 domain-containing protein [Acidobacteriota bacterium]
MMKRGLLILSLAGALSLGSCAREARSSERKIGEGRARTVVLELFTSQGCSSCPPADALLSRLRREDFGGSTVIPLAYHVDYWNHLGWSDPFSSPHWTQRQNLYAKALKSDQIYTPQLIINGAAPLVGSAEGPIRAEIERQLDGSDRGAVLIDRVALAGKELTVDLRARLDARTPASPAGVVVVLFENGVTTAVASGENARRTLTNDAIVRWQEERFVLSANGVESKASVTIPLSAGWRTDRLGVAAFIQDRASLAIHASAARGIGEQ